MHRGLVLGLVLAAFGGLLAIVVAVRAPAPVDPAGDPTPTATPVDTLAIGAIVPTAGSGEAIRAGLALAAKALNAEWKQAPALELVLKDPQGSAETARAQLKALREQGVSLLAGLTGPELAIACSGPIRKGEVVVVASGNPGTGLLSRRMGKGYFDVAPSAAPEARGLTELARRLRAERVCVVHSPAQRARAEAFRLSWGALPSRAVVPLERAEQVPWAVERIAAANAQAVVLLLEPALAGALVAGAPKVERWVGAGELGAEAFARAAPKADLTRVVFVVQASAKQDAQVEAARQRALAAWRAAHGAAEPPAGALAAYDALTILARAAKAARSKAGKVDLQRVLRGLRATRHVGATGRIQFDGSGGRVAPAFEARTYTAGRVQVPLQGTK